MITYNPHIAEDLERLRDEYIPQAFDAEGRVEDVVLANVVWKINSCLYKGYPRRPEIQQ